MTKIKVAVLMGGRSPEHEISILSGQQVVLNLDPHKYDILPIVISKKGNWTLTSPEEIKSLSNPIALKGTSKEIVLGEKTQVDISNKNMSSRADVFFIAMHGPNGEDGTIQGLIGLMGTRYTGSGVLASALGMDKVAFRKILKAENILVPKYLVIKKGQQIKNLNKVIGNPPYFIKPSKQGSSVGASIARTNKQLEKSIEDAFLYDNEVLIDEYIAGREITCAIIGNDNPIPLPLIEIKPLKGEFFDYESKYLKSGAEEIVPAELSKKLTTTIQNIALNVYKAIGCRGFGRVDFILRDDMPYVLEVNTIPGLTRMSLLPKAAKAGGLSYEDLLDRIIKYAIEKN